MWIYIFYEHKKKIFLFQSDQMCSQYMVTKSQYIIHCHYITWSHRHIFFFAVTQNKTSTFFFKLRVGFLLRKCVWAGTCSNFSGGFRIWLISSCLPLPILCKLLSWMDARHVSIEYSIFFFCLIYPVHNFKLCTEIAGVIFWLNDLLKKKTNKKKYKF